MAQQVTTWIDVLAGVAARHPDKAGFRYLTDGDAPPGDNVRDLVGTRPVTADAVDLTYAEFDRRARAVAAYLIAEGLTDRRVVLWYPSGLDYLAAFFGCLYARAVAVPAYPPSPRRLDRVIAILRDCAPDAILTTAAVRDKIEAGSATAGLPEGVLGFLPRLITTDTLGTAGADVWVRPDVTGDTLAFLQYTSGSTSAPRGVMLTHDNLLANSALTHRLFDTSEATSAVSWLPMYHDMGLIGAILQTVYCAGRCVVMSPYAFAKHPLRWLQTISDVGANASGAPNFAYDLCVDRTAPAERAALDLRNWRLAFNGAEPIRPATLRRFAEAFAVSGFRPEAFTPCYGLAEATLMVTSTPLARGVATDTPPSPGGGELVGAGVVPDGVRVEIVDPVHRVPRPAGVEGEIWVSGPGVGQGYWERPAETEATFRAVLDGTDGPAFLRTGDLGYLRGGELFITGRHKDLIIVRGQNHYPQDIEQTVERVNPVLRRNGGAAFSVPVDGREQLVVIHEIDRHHDGVDLTALAAQVTAAVAAAHEVRPHAVAFIKANSLPRTSSGKVQRHRAKKAFTEGRLDVVTTPSEQDTAPVAAVPAPAVGPVVEPVTGPFVDPATGPAAAAVATSGPVNQARVAQLTELLRREIADLVGLTPIEVRDDEPLVQLGLDSMAAATLEHRVERVIGVRLTLDEALTRNLTEVANLLASRSTAASAASAASVLSAASAVSNVSTASTVSTGPVDHPVSANQASLWVLHRLVPDAPAHIIAAAARVEGGVDAPALATALEHVAARHEALRTTFPIVDSVPVQRVHVRLSPIVETHDATGWTDEARTAHRGEAAYAPFDVEAGPLVRLTVFRCRDGADEVVIAVHHLIADLWSMELLLRELDVAYPRALAGTLRAPTGTPSTYRAFTARQTAVLAERGEQLWEHWRDQLAGAPTLLSVPVNAVTGLRRFRATTASFRLDAGATARLTALAKAEQTTMYAVLLSAFQSLLGQWSGADDVLVGSPTHNRRSGDADAVGLFVNMLVLRGRLHPDRTVAELVRAAGQTVRTAVATGDLPFATIVERAQPVRDPSRSALIQAVLTLHRPVSDQRDSISSLALGLPGAEASVGGMKLGSLALDGQGSQFDLQLTLAEVGGELVGALTYDTDLFTAPAIGEALDQLAVLLGVFGNEPGTRLRDLPGFTPVGARPVRATEPVESTVDTTVVSRELHRVDDMFAARAAATPLATAVVWDGGALTYAELDAAADHLAARLRHAGVGPETLVGLFLDRSPEMVTSVLAVLRAGGAYVPLDPAYPADRVEYVLADSAAPVIVTRASLRGKLPVTGAVVLAVDEPGEAGEAGEVGVVTPRVARPGPDRLDHLAYIIYTSGSSGRPKGVQVAHRSVANLFAATLADFGFDRTDVWTLFHSYAFDFSVWEIWGPLVTGGTLAIVPTEATLSAAGLWDLVQHRGVTVLNQTPAVFREMTVAAPERLAELPLRHIVFGGEKLEPAHLAVWRRHGNPDTRITNMYGITEITVHATYAPLGSAGTTGTPGTVSSAPVPPLGTALAGTELLLLDDGADTVGAGAVGEICIGGAGLARGYLNRPELTAQKFTPHPTRAGQRVYRSGDLGRRTPDGTLEYLGRADDQVKIRGYRIEPGEVAAAVAAHPSVRDAFVTAVDDTRGRVRLVAYVVPADATTVVVVADLRTQARTRVPEYMVPSAFVILDALPLTVNGKVDRAALPNPDESGRASQAAPATETERVVAAFVGEMLEISVVGRDEDLFDLGWHSLLMARLALRIRNRFGVEVPLPELFVDPSVQRISAMIDAGAPRATVRTIAAVDRSRYVGQRSDSGALQLPFGPLPRTGGRTSVGGVVPSSRPADY